VTSGDQRSAYHHGGVHEAAIAAVTAIVRSDGPSAVTVRSVAERVGVTHAALYRHVASLDALLDEAAAAFLATLTGDGPPDETPEQFLAGYVSVALDDVQLYRLAFSQAASPDAAPATAEALRALRDRAAVVFPHAWPDDGRAAMVHRVMRTWSTVHGMLDLAAHGLVAARSRAGLARYVVESGMRTARAE
jgi:AcrR family transcriptional regulator